MKVNYTPQTQNTRSRSKRGRGVKSYKLDQLKEVIDIRIAQKEREAGSDMEQGPIKS